MKDEFLPYEYAKMLKELGFQEKCFAVIDERGMVYRDDKPANRAGEHTTAPLYQQAEQWLWGKLRCHVVVSSDGRGCFGFGDNSSMLESPIAARREAIRLSIWQLHQELKK